LSEPLLSNDWYRVAHMRPRLRSGVLISRQQVRGETWYVLFDPVSGRHHRFNSVAYALIGCCDGRATLDEVWAARVQTDGDRAPTQADAIRVVAQAFTANLFVGDVAPDAAAIVKAHARASGERRRAALNPLALRVPLWDPDAFLSDHLHRVRWLFGRGVLAATYALIALGTVLLALNADAVAAFARTELATGRMLLLMWLVYPVMKALHEMAHAFAVKRHGGEVHQIGLTLLLLTPLPYVDASASVAFAEKRARLGVAAAGIVVEALLASVALMLWLALEPGLTQHLAFAVLFVGVLSTLVVNGNPLLRFDGYYVLCDAAELPNLAARSHQYWAYLLKRHLLRLHRAPPVAGGLARGERPWLVAYAPLAWVYRSALFVGAALLAAQWNQTVGLMLLGVAAWSALVKPAWSLLRWLSNSPELRASRARAGLAMLIAGSLAVTGAVAVPVPLRTHAHGVVWLPDDAMLRTATDGFIEEILVQDGATVRAGTPIARLSNEPLHVDLARVQAQLERQQVERTLYFERDAQRSAAAHDASLRLAAERDRLRERIAGLTLRAGVAGRLAIDPRHAVPGKFLAQGDLVAQVIPEGAALVRTLVRHQDIDLLRQRPAGVTVQLAHAPADDRQATMTGATPQASLRLPSAAMGEAAGGSILLDHSDASGRTAREPHFQIDVQLADSSATAHIGARALVTFTHGQTTLAQVAGRFIRASFLRHFDR
jgi:putative peptide zinc metalloprotease protein